MEKQLLQTHEFNKYSGNDVSNTPRWISEDEFNAQYNLIKEEVTEISQAFDEKNMVEVVDGLVDSLYVLFGLVNRMGLAHEVVRGFEEIHENNLTKIFDSEGRLIVKRNEAGKVIKPEGYQKVKLENVFPYLKTIR